MLLKTLILGLGNPILGDDGIGWRIVEMLRDGAPNLGGSDRTQWEESSLIEFDCAALSGLSLMERLIGYDRVLLVDAMNIPGLPAGEVIMTNVQAISQQQSSRLTSAHDTTLHTALEIGRQLGAQIPAEINILGVNTAACFDFSDTLSIEVTAAIPAAIQHALHWLSQDLSPEFPKASAQAD